MSFTLSEIRRLSCWKMRIFATSVSFGAPAPLWFVTPLQWTPQKFLHTSYAQKLQFIGHVFVAEAHALLSRTWSALKATTYKAHWSRIRHSGSFEVILIGVRWTPELGVVMCNNHVDLISETYEDATIGKLRIPRFQPPHSGLTTVVR